MKVPVEWLHEYININKDSKELASAFTMIGLLLDKPYIQYSVGEYKTDVLDLEHRMDRVDWLSILGCARDVAAYFDMQIKYPETLLQKLPHVPNELRIDIKVDCPELVFRFNTVVIKNAKVAASPLWLKNRLEAYGIPSINNIVDITNYVMVEYGQPMHAQDIDKMRAKEIHIRMAANGETLKTFLGETMKLDSSMFVLTQAGTPTVIGGIVGGEETGVDLATKNIILDAGNYNQVNVRQTSRKLKIQNETVLRYDKFLHPALTQAAIERATYLIKELSGGEIFFNDDYVSPKANMGLKLMTLRKSRIDLLSGEDFDFERAKGILNNLEYKIVEQTSNTLKVQIPYFRTDVEVEDDIVADILRINGYNKIKLAQLAGTAPKDITPSILKLEDKIRDISARAGLNEYITSPFVEATGSKNEIVLLNTINQGMNALRTNLEQTLRVNLNTYIDNSLGIEGIFEIGTVFFSSNEKEQKLEETRNFQVITYPQANPVETAKKTRSLLATIMKNLGYKYAVCKENKKNIIFANDVVLGQITHDTFFLDTNKLLTLSVENLVIREKVQNLKIRDITFFSDNERIGEALHYLKNGYPDLTNIEVTSVYKDSTAKVHTIGVRLYFTESVLDAEKIKNAILTELNKKYGVTSMNLV